MLHKSNFIPLTRGGGKLHYWEKRKNKNAEQLGRIFTKTTQPQVYEDSGGKQLLTLLTGHKVPTAFKKKDHEACNSNYIRPVFQNLCPKKQMKRPSRAKRVKNTLVDTLPKNNENLVNNTCI